MANAVRSAITATTELLVTITSKPSSSKLNNHSCRQLSPHGEDIFAGALQLEPVIITL